MTSARVEAAARIDFNLSRGLEPEATAEWEELGGRTRAQALSRAAVMVAAIDAVDDRVRLTFPEFHSIKAEAIYDLSFSMHQDWNDDQRTAAQTAGIPEYIEAYRAKLDQQYLDPINHEAAMASLIRERTAAALRSTADGFDHASLSDITADMDIDAGVPPRFKRVMINGCADWLRRQADDLDEGGRLPYFRVDTRVVIDQDRHTALLRALSATIGRANRMASTDRISTSFIMTDNLVEAIEGVGATLPVES